MTANLSASQYLALCQDKGYIVRNVIVNGTRYKVDYDDTPTHSPGATTGVQPVLGSLSQEGKQDDGGKGIQQSNTGSRSADNPQSSGNGKADGPMEKGCNPIGRIMAQSKEMARYLDLDDGTGELDTETQPDAATGPQRGISESVGSHEVNQPQLCGAPKLDSGGQSGISEAQSPQEPVTDDARNTEVKNCENCTAPLDPDGTCGICRAISGLKAVCDRKRREYHAFKSGQRADTVQ